MTENELFKNIDKSFLAKCKVMMENNQDPSHDWNHATDVAKASVILSEMANVPLLPLLLASIAHDVYSGVDRVSHHTLSSIWVKAALPKTIHSDLTEDVALCCAQHRASYKGEYSGILQEVFASADRGVMDGEAYDRIVKRSFQYSLLRTSNDRQKAIEMVVEHMHVKYGSAGYARYPRFYRMLNGPCIDNVQLQADFADYSRIEKILVRQGL